MFLVNSPPVVAFPTQWMPFGPKTTHKVPLSVVHSEQIHKAPNLLGILDSQQSNESSCAVKVEYERIMQKNRKGELSNDRGLKASATLFKGHTREQASSTLPTKFKVQEEESSPALDSDSDDSVDRGIEEAIQEYLKNRSTADTSSTTAATKNPSSSDHSDQLKTACSNAPARKSPVKMVTSSTTCNAFSTLDCSRCSSPESVGSDDSFEQSIKDEIEQFLNQKKLQNTLSDTSIAKKPAQSNITAKPKQKPFKAAEKQGPKQGIKGLPDKLPSESLQPKSPKQKGDHFKTSIYPKALSSSVKPRDQKNEAASRQCEELSDSSSDDGIEEAIQLYQLEKSRLEGNPVVVQKCSLEKVANSTTTYPGTLSPCHTNTDYKKRKLPSSSHAASQDTATNHPPTTKKTFYFGDDANAKCEIATRRAETAAELMCAEAILDISKAILPSQPETACVISQERPPTQPKSPCVSDSSVDSDDGIEQEIQTFLARKAQEESLAMSPIKQSSPNPQRLDQRKQHSLSNNKTLSQKGKVMESKAVQKDMVGRGEKRNTDVIGIASTVSLSPEILQTRNTDVGMKEHSKASYKSEEVKQIVQETAESLVSLPRITGGKRKTYTKIRNNCSVDTSSSLDSDEDLDSAIKDLLRSKRKCKKRPKDGRPQYKKRVRFGETTTRTLESLGSGGDLMDCLLKPAVKSCLVYSSNSQENTLKPNFNVTEDKRSVASNSDISPNKPECKPASASDKPLGLSSALPETQDSSSVDSDDSIEQEIRKFLAERARESAELCAVQKAPQSVTSLSVFTQTPASLSNPTPIKQEPRVLSISETETILQKVMEKDRSTAPVPQPTLIQRVPDYKDVVPQVRLIQRPPAEVPKISAPVHSVIVKRECFIDKNRVVRPAEKVLQTAPERVIVKTGVNGSQGSSPVSGNFVAGLKYISGTDQQLLLNMGKASSTRMATELYSPGGNITRLGTCQPVQKKTLILEQPKIVQAPAFSLNTPVVRPALYVVTTKVVKDTPTALCLPINTAAYDAGLNLMSIQYCQGQVAAHTPVRTTPFPFQQNRGSEIVVNIPGTPGEALPLGTKAKESQSVTRIASRSYLKEKSAEAIGTGSDVSLNSSGSSAKKENICRSPIDPGWKLEPYIMLSPEEICRNAGRTFCKRMSQDKKADAIHKKTAELLVKKLRF
ncbi:protein phosphatase 1 regulatory subunit 26 isoform X2 [Rana temporaria]|uniref:protein phosphatase 1 regulatory subunit 26 isoform X2 n=1 Tax=Rana temporaria TaxID=8407 RepID=UPI001AACB5CB|nr:protein phosphatase 1 regulatory subunit 26 isoform X2 [Rana temporaria]